jgi:hypothetical protein
MMANNILDFSGTLNSESPFHYISTTAYNESVTIDGRSFDTVEEETKACMSNIKSMLERTSGRLIDSL